MSTHPRRATMPKPEAVTYTGGQWLPVGQAQQNLGVVATRDRSGQERNGGKSIVQLYGPDQKLNARLIVKAPIMHRLLRDLVATLGASPPQLLRGLAAEVHELLAELPEPGP
jgi:hypothetical protein